MSLDERVATDRPTLPRYSTQDSDRFRRLFWHKFSGKDRPWVSWRKSACAIFYASC